MLGEFSVAGAMRQILAMFSVSWGIKRNHGIAEAIHFHSYYLPELARALSCTHAFASGCVCLRLQRSHTQSLTQALCANVALGNCKALQNNLI